VLKNLKAFEVEIVALRNGSHQYHFLLDNDFFAYFQNPTLAKGDCQAVVVLEKNERLIRVSFQLKGKLVLTCDRSLDEFDFPIKLKEEIIFKYGEEEKEITEDMWLITPKTPHLALGEFMYEFVVLAIPMKKLHPRYADEHQSSDYHFTLVYSSQDSPTASDESESEPDPRWNVLKKLKNAPNQPEKE
jgi:uncharacterized protein